MKQSIDKTSYTRSGSQRGLSLIELMISITIGLLILVSLSTLFINQSRTRAELDKSNRMIDNGRYAMDVLSSNLKLAGYYDSYAPTGLSLGAIIADPCDTGALIVTPSNSDILNLHVLGYNATTSTVPALASKCAAILTANSVTLRTGSDILVIRRASTISPRVLASAAVQGMTYVQVSGCPADLSAYLIATAPTTFPLFLKDCSTPAYLRPFLIQVYFVSPDNNPAGNFTGTRPVGCTGDCIPTLKRLEFDPTCNGSVNPCPLAITPLVEGIEYMQIDYGVDNLPVIGNAIGDGVADSYTDCSGCSIADWSNVVSVKINLLARNLAITQGWNETKTYNLGIDGAVGPFGNNEVTTPVKGAYKRHVYTELVRLNNPAGRRETPCSTTPCR